jgi:DNA-binding XRE family transcriptional regulator
MDLLMVFGIELRQWRRKNGISSAAMAAMLGVTPGSIARIEVGGQNVSVKVFARLPEALKARYRELLGEPETSAVNGQKRAFNACPEQVKRRKCLGCPKQFTSKNYGNRLCRSCTDRNKLIDDGGTYTAMRSKNSGVLT